MVTLGGLDEWGMFDGHGVHARKESMENTMKYEAWLILQ